MTRTLDLLRNHGWNAQALICDLGDDANPNARFSVTVEPIKGPAYMAVNPTYHHSEEMAYHHAKVCLGFPDE